MAVLPLAIRLLVTLLLAAAATSSLAKVTSRKAVVARKGVLPRLGPADALSKLKSPHPMLFFSAEDIPQLQQKARTSHKMIADRIRSEVEVMKKEPAKWQPPQDHKQFTKRWNENHGNNLCTLAIYCVLFPEDEAALSLAHQFMDTMVSHKSWEFTKMATDEMPISHSLVGMATAYDFLYPTLSVEQRQTYFERIRKTTARHFERFKDTSWGRWHLQNHVWNNNVALLIGAVVTSVHDPRAHEWARMTIAHLNISMKFHNLIVDGSNSEGVSYSTYTTRSMTMFLNLIDRHYQTNAYASNWLAEYVNFLYHTYIAYRETVGIGDSYTVWWYGPESMLVFIDKYVLRNGKGNWLAARIRENRPAVGVKTPYSPTINQRCSTYHTEFLWYDETLGETDPNPTRKPQLALFSDWGVVTYGGGLPPGQTFFSFKCGMMHGRTVNRAVKERNVFPQYVEGWKSFNPGHEHPDQGSFTFWPRGEPFVTDDYYNSKFTFLNNGIMFGPSPTAKCFPPYEGQLGECHKWLDYMSPDLQYATADIRGAYLEEGFAYVSGEFKGAYRKQFQLQSVYRNLALLTPDVLLIVDHIVAPYSGMIDTANTFFNMQHGILTLEDSNTLPSYQEAVMRMGNGSEYRVSWRTCGSVRATASTKEYDVGYGLEKSRHHQILNITVELQRPWPTRMAYILYNADSPKPRRPRFVHTGLTGVKVGTSIDGEMYELAIATDHLEVNKRLDYLGHPGFATLSRSSASPVEFGGREDIVSLVSHLPTVFLSSMEYSGGEMLAAVLARSVDLAVTSMTTLARLNQPGIVSNTLPDVCVWDPANFETKKREFPQWLHDIFATEYSSITGLRMIKPPNLIKNKKTNARLVIYAAGGQMDTKLNLFPIKPSTRVLYLARDPRAWVAFAVQSGKSKFILTDSIPHVLRTAECLGGKLSKPYRHLKELIKEKSDANNIEALALYWSGHVLGAIQSEPNAHFKLVWLDDLIREPEATLEGVVEGFLGLPLAPASRHLLLQYTRSSELRLPSGELLRHTDMEWWRKVLHPEEVRRVERVTSEFTGYTPPL